MIQTAALLADSDWPRFLNGDTLSLAIPLLAILVGGIIVISKALIRHRERMAMIDRGMHPDYPPEQGEPQDES
jgi:hypothetical protein